MEELYQKLLIEFWNNWNKEEKCEMRNPDRLNGFYEKVKEIHQKCFPDWRFGQLCSNFFGWLSSVKGRDLFFPEEDEMLNHLKEYAKEYSQYEYRLS